MRNIIFLILITIAFACKKEQNSNRIKNESGKFSICNNSLPNCTRGTGEYCLFGYKWGADSSFFEAGINANGPQTSGGVITFSFQEKNGSVNTHRQINLESQSFNNLLGCAKTEIRNALDTWSEVADIDFKELPENSSSSIRFFVADIIQSGVGFTNFTESPCDAIKGTMIIQTGNSIDNCEDFYLFSLHEIGHVLGLGHVISKNIMNPDFPDFDLEGLQEGDRKGIIQLYGAK